MPPAAIVATSPTCRWRCERVDFTWKWEPRPQPLRELYLDEFFGKCFGMYAAVRRQGLDRASKKDIAYCTTWLRENGWRRVTKQLPDGQRVAVWRASDPSPTSTQASEVGSTLTEKTSQTGDHAGVVDVTGAADVAGVAGAAGNMVGQHIPNVDPSRPNVDPKNQLKAISNQSLSSASTQEVLSEVVPESEFSKEVDEKFYFEVVRGKSRLGLRGSTCPRWVGARHVR
jgi:hypothetical protein